MSVVTVRSQVGPQVLADGAEQALRGEKSGALVVQELHGRFYEQNYRGNVYSDGMGLTSISNATFTSGSVSVSSTITSIAGVWNPSTSPVNLVILQATLGVTLTALAATGGGPYVWAMSVGNTAITTGATPLNRKSLALSGSYAKGLTNTAPTGITNNLVARFGSALFGGSLENVSFTATAVAMQTQQFSSVENFDGSLIVPPGGVLSLLATTTPVAHSAVSSLLWEEVPV